MSVDFVAFGFKFLVTKPRAVVLSVWIGVGGCLWLISFNNRLAGIACLEFKNNAPISASAADERFWWFWQYLTLLHCSWGLGYFQTWRNSRLLCFFLLALSGMMYRCAHLTPFCLRWKPKMHLGALPHNLKVSTFSSLFLLLALIVGLLLHLV